MACTLAGWSASVRGDLPHAVCSCSVATTNRRATDTAPDIAEVLERRCFSMLLGRFTSNHMIHVIPVLAVATCSAYKQEICILQVCLN